VRFMEDESYKPTLSVVIPAYNEEDCLAQTIASVQKAGDRLRAEKKQAIEIIVVDNNSKDRTGEVAREAGARVVFEPQNNISRARNAGAAVARGEFLAFVDADMLISDDLLCAIDENLMNPGSVGGGTRTRPDRWSITVMIFWMIESVARFLFGGFDGVLHCRHKEFFEMGGFSEKHYVAEKIDFYKRLKLHGRWRSQEIKDAPRGHAVVSMRMLAEHGFWTFLKNVLPFLWRPNRKVCDLKYCKLWYKGVK